MATKNPFPGMNPFLERNWGPVHTKLISLIDDEIGRQLPPDLITRPEERITIDEFAARKDYRPDIAISDRWKSGMAPVWDGDPATSTGGLLAEPQMVWIEETVERWIEIRTADGSLVTVIEVLSPANKTGAGREAYRTKQHSYLESQASLVEIDLLRDGSHVLAAPLERVREKAPGTCYHICVSRSWTPHVREVYSCPLRERLPAFRVPLRQTDPDAVLDLQPLIDRCYDAGRYYLSPHDREPHPPFEGDEAVWVDGQLRGAGLRG